MLKLCIGLLHKKKWTLRICCNEETTFCVSPSVSSLCMEDERWLINYSLTEDFQIRRSCQARFMLVVGFNALVLQVKENAFGAVLLLQTGGSCGWKGMQGCSKMGKLWDPCSFFYLPLACNDHIRGFFCGHFSIIWWQRHLTEVKGV